MERNINLTSDQFDQLILDVEFIQSTLNAAVGHDQDEFDLSPILAEATQRAAGISSLLSEVRT